MAAAMYLEFARFFLVLMRVGGFFILNPFFGSQMIPTQVKVGISLMMTISIFQLIPGVDMFQMSSIIPFALMVVRELLVGIFIGLVALSFFEGIRLAGQVFGIQMGFGIVNVMDPSNRTQISIISVIKFFLSMLIFLSINGHHHLLIAIKDSFTLIPLGVGLVPTAALGREFVQQIGLLFVIAVRIALPLMSALICVTFVLGILAKAVPKIQVFLMSFPIKIGLGLLMLAAFMNYLDAYYCRIFQYIFESIYKLMKVM